MGLLRIHAKHPVRNPLELSDDRVSRQARKKSRAERALKRKKG